MIEFVDKIINLLVNPNQKKKNLDKDVGKDDFLANKSHEEIDYST